MAKCYQYTSDGYFAGENDDYGLLPNNATHTAPVMQDGYVPHWTGEKWEQVENHKGKEGYLNGQPSILKEYGPLPEGWSDTPPPPTPEEEQAVMKAEKMAQLEKIDKASIRPARAIAAGSATEEDKAHLLALENEANILRIELSMLTVGAV